MPEEGKRDIAPRTACTAGGLLEGAHRSLIGAAAVADVAFSPHRYGTFADAPSATSAAPFATHGVDIRAVKR